MTGSSTLRSSACTSGDRRRTPSIGRRPSAWLLRCCRCPCRRGASSLAFGKEACLGLLSCTGRCGATPLGGCLLRSLRTALRSWAGFSQRNRHLSDRSICRCGGLWGCRLSSLDDRIGGSLCRPCRGRTHLSGICCYAYTGQTCPQLGGLDRSRTDDHQFVSSHRLDRFLLGRTRCILFLGDLPVGPV